MKAPTLLTLSNFKEIHNLAECYISKSEIKLARHHPTPEEENITIA
jgi:hypothetical protein